LIDLIRSRTFRPRWASIKWHIKSGDLIGSGFLESQDYSEHCFEQAENILIFDNLWNRNISDLGFILVLVISKVSY